MVKASGESGCLKEGRPSSSDTRANFDGTVVLDSAKCVVDLVKSIVGDGAPELEMDFNRPCILAVIESREQPSKMMDE